VQYEDIKVTPISSVMQQSSSTLQISTFVSYSHSPPGNPNPSEYERWGAGVETQKNVRGEIGGWGRVPFNEPYAPLLSTIYDGA